MKQSVKRECLTSMPQQFAHKFYLYPAIVLLKSTLCRLSLCRLIPLVLSSINRRQFYLTKVTIRWLTQFKSLSGQQTFSICHTDFLSFLPYDRLYGHRARNKYAPSRGGFVSKFFYSQSKHSTHTHLQTHTHTQFVVFRDVLVSAQKIVTPIILFCFCRNVNACCVLSLFSISIKRQHLISK